MVTDALKAGGRGQAPRLLDGALGQVIRVDVLHQAAPNQIPLQIAEPAAERDGVADRQSPAPLAIQPSKTAIRIAIWVAGDQGIDARPHHRMRHPVPTLDRGALFSIDRPDRVDPGAPLLVDPLRCVEDVHGHVRREAPLIRVIMYLTQWPWGGTFS